MRHAVLLTTPLITLSVIGLLFTMSLTHAATPTPSPMPTPCVLPPPLNNLGNSQDEDVKKLGNFQNQFGYVGDSLSFFTVMPVSEGDLDEAEGVATKLKAFAAAGIKPVVFIEPPAEQNIADIVDGVIEIPWEAYFTRMKSTGVTSQQMGLWIPYPEFNTPIWNREWSEPGDFSTVVNDFSTAYKKVFPGAKAGILLNSFTYEASDVNWEHGKATSFLPFVSGIVKGNVDVVGIQAFPWFPRKNQPDRKPLDLAPRFLFMRILAEAATKVGAKDILIHTGTQHVVHAGSEQTRVEISNAKRGAILRGVFTMARTYKRLGWNVSVSLFTENKAIKKEGTDWSYDSSSAFVLTNAAKTAYCNKIPLVMF